MKITIVSNSAKLLGEMSRILKDENKKDKISEVLDLLKKNNVNWVVEDYSVGDDSVTFSIKVN